MTSENTLVITENNLSAVSCDDVMRDLDVFMQRRREDNIVLDLSQLGFVDPYGMGMLCLIGASQSSFSFLSFEQFYIPLPNARKSTCNGLAK